MPYTVFPLHGIVRDAEGRAMCACGKPDCSSDPGRHPRVAWSTLAAGEQVRGPEGCSYAIATGHRSNVFVVDTDNAEADAAFRAMGDLPETYVVKTPRGRHYYFTWPGWAVHTGKNVIGTGIDVRGDGGMVVAAGGAHKSGGTYVVESNIPVAPAPPWLLERHELRGRIQDNEPGDNAPTPVTPESPVWAERVRLGVEACQTWDPSGGTTLFKLALRLVRDLELPLDKCQTLIMTHYNPRACDPSGKAWPWTDKDVRHKLVEARDKSDIKPGNAAELNLVAPKADDADAWLSNLSQPEPEKPFLQFGGWDRDPPPVEFLVDGLLPKGSISKWFGHADSLKTWLLFSLAIAVSRGEPWLGRYPTRRCKVAIVDYETGKNNLHRRLHMLGAGDNPNLGAVSIPAEKTTDQALWEKLIAADVGLVIIDSLRAGDGDLDENSSKEAIAPLRWAARFSEHTGAAVAFIHHARKSNNGEIVSRGSAAIKDQVDCAYTVKAEGGDEKRTITLSCEKPGDMRKPADLSVDVVFDDAARKVTMSVPESTATHTGPDGHRSTAMRLYEVLMRQGPFDSQKDMAKAVGLRPRAVKEDFEALEEKCLAACIEGKYRADSKDERRARVLAKVAVLDTAGSKVTAKQLAAMAAVHDWEVQQLVDNGTLAANPPNGLAYWSVNRAGV